MRNQQASPGNQAQASKLDPTGVLSNSGDCLLAPLDATSFVYGDEQAAALLFMIEEEKMAGDLYEQFFDQTGLKVFDNIAASEDRHMAALLDQALLAGIDVSGVISLPAGEYLNQDLPALYGELLAAGSASADAALTVGQQVEQVDIADLEGAMVAVVGTPLEAIYSNLENGSTHHLAAFDLWLAA